MEIADYLRFAAALVLVLGLIGLAAWAVRRLGLAGRLAITGRGPRRISVVETAALGPKHRLVLVRRDGVEHLVLLAPTGNVVVERGIPVTAVANIADGPRATAEAAQ